MFNGEEFVTAKGVVLSREQQGENFLWTRLFLQGEGIVSVSSKNFMGDSEPFVWGYFYLQRKSKSRNYFVFDNDIRDSMLKIRRGYLPIRTAFDWVILLIKYLVPEHPDDDLLNNLYWSMKLLTVPVVPVEAVNWRFIWKWLQEWGLAPEFYSFHSQNGFRDEEIILLTQTSELTVNGVTQLFSGKITPTVRQNVFKVASTLALPFFKEI